MRFRIFDQTSDKRFANFEFVVNIKYINWKFYLQSYMKPFQQLPLLIMIKEKNNKVFREKGYKKQIRWSSLFFFNLISFIKVLCLLVFTADLFLAPKDIFTGVVNIWALSAKQSEQKWPLFIRLSKCIFLNFFSSPTLLPFDVHRTFLPLFSIHNHHSKWRK